MQLHDLPGLPRLKDTNIPAAIELMALSENVHAKQLQLYNFRQETC